MRWRFAALTVPLALVASGLLSRAGFAAPLMQAMASESAAFLERVDVQRTNNPLSHCFKRKGTRSCPGVAATTDRKGARTPHPAAVPGVSTGPAASPGTLPLPSSPPAGTGASRTTAKRPVGPRSGDSVAGTGLKFTGGVGVPTNRVTLEGALSPYQQPNGNTAASTSGKLTNGIEEQGMHFGLEWHY
jgi:hypothetical protein